MQRAPWRRNSSSGSGADELALMLEPVLDRRVGRGRAADTRETRSACPSAQAPDRHAHVRPLGGAGARLHLLQRAAVLDRHDLDEARAIAAPSRRGSACARGLPVKLAWRAMRRRSSFASPRVRLCDDVDEAVAFPDRRRDARAPRALVLVGDRLEIDHGLVAALRRSRRARRARRRRRRSCRRRNCCRSRRARRRCRRSCIRSNGARRLRRPRSRPNCARRSARRRRR